MIGEQHFTVQDIAGDWRVHPETVRRIFRDEPGVLVISTGNFRRGRHRYETIRIPVSVRERVEGQRRRQ